MGQNLKLDSDNGDTSILNEKFSSGTKNSRQTDNDATTKLHYQCILNKTYIFYLLHVTRPFCDVFLRILECFLFPVLSLRYLIWDVFKLIRIIKAFQQPSSL